MNACLQKAIHKDFLVGGAFLPTSQVMHLIKHKPVQVIIMYKTYRRKFIRRSL